MNNHISLNRLNLQESNRGVEYILVCSINNDPFLAVNCQITTLPRTYYLLKTRNRKNGRTKSSSSSVSGGLYPKLGAEVGGVTGLGVG